LVERRRNQRHGDVPRSESGTAALLCSDHVDATPTTTNIPMAMLTTQHRKFAIAALEFYFWGNFVGIDDKQIVTIVSPEITAGVLQDRLFPGLADQKTSVSDAWFLAVDQSRVAQRVENLPRHMKSLFEEKEVFVPMPSTSSVSYLKSVNQTAEQLSGTMFLDYISTFKIEKTPMLVLKA